MGVLDYFKPVSSMDADEAREFLKSRKPGDYNLVDVRQPKEYEQGHIPGAKLIPVGELPERLEEIDRGRPVIAYCASGVRSRAAASVLSGQGFNHVYSMEGGIRAWNGLKATGIPDSGTAYFGEGKTAEELIALAWILEDGSGRFYSELTGRFDDKDAVKLFNELAGAEENHKSALIRLFEAVTGRSAGREFPHSVLSSEPSGDVMEGGMSLSKALRWAEGRDITDILELAISLETNSYDLYIKMMFKTKQSESSTVFSALAEDERRHLDKLTVLFEKRV